MNESFLISKFFLVSAIRHQIIKRDKFCLNKYLCTLDCLIDASASLYSILVYQIKFAICIKFPRIFQTSPASFPPSLLSFEEFSNPFLKSTENQVEDLRDDKKSF